MTALRLLPLKTWLVLGVVVFCVVMTLAWCHARREAKGAKAEASVAAATGKALDSVAKETPAIRQEQQEKQREVDTIQGADQRLPDGFGADLERVRRGRERNDSRQP